MPTQIFDSLATQVSDTGFFPEIVIEALNGAVGDIEAEDFFVHREPIFDLEVAGHHLTVLILLSGKLVVGHFDETDLGQGPRIVASTEVIPLPQINAVSLNKAYAFPEGQEVKIKEAWVNIAWGIAQRLELRENSCGDPSCDKDHGSVGTVMADDITLRVSVAGDGILQMQRFIRFVQKLQQAIGKK